MSKDEVQALFSERLKGWMNATGHNISSLSRALQTKRQGVARWVNGGMPDFYNLRLLAMYSGVSVDWWLGLDTEYVDWVADRWQA